MLINVFGVWVNPAHITRVSLCIPGRPDLGTAVGLTNYQISFTGPGAPTPDQVAAEINRLVTRSLTTESRDCIDAVAASSEWDDAPRPERPAAEDLARRLNTTFTVLSVKDRAELTELVRDGYCPHCWRATNGATCHCNNDE